MKLLLWTLLLALLLPALPTQAYYNVIMSWAADPNVRYHNGFYYWTHATGNKIFINKSKTLTGIGLSTQRPVYTPQSPYNNAVWGAELIPYNNKWYIYYTADNGQNVNHRIFVLESEGSDPMGPYTLKGRVYDANNDYWAIGPNMFQYNGKLYLIWSGHADGSTSVCVKQNTYIAELTNPWTVNPNKSRVQISTPNQPWEINYDIHPNCQNGKGVQESHEVLIRNNKIFVVYSSNHSLTDDYKLGMIWMSTANNQDPLVASNWQKYTPAGASSPQPVFSKNAANGVYGPGSHSFTTSPDGTEDYIVYHAAIVSGSQWYRNGRTQKFTWDANGFPSFGVPVSTSTNLALPSGETDDAYGAVERYWDSAIGWTLDPAGGTAAVSGGQLHLASNNGSHSNMMKNIAPSGGFSLDFRARVTDFAGSGVPQNDKNSLGTKVSTGYVRLMVSVQSDGIYAITANSNGDWVKVYNMAIDSNWHDYYIRVGKSDIANLYIDGAAAKAANWPLPVNAESPRIAHWVAGTSADAAEAYVDHTIVRSEFYSDHWDSITADWEANSQGTIEINPGGLLHMANATGVASSIKNERKDAAPAGPYVYEFKAQITDYSSSATTESLATKIVSDNKRMMLHIESDGLYVKTATSGGNWVKVYSLTGDPDHQWHVWRVEANHGTGQAKAFKDGVELASWTMEEFGWNPSNEAQVHPGIHLWTKGTTADPSEVYIDWMRVYSGK
ncbi:hypothetical protein PAESOLCIP111_01014 [Paenibacillus solanacearum]|uniref:Uncharacterized protein n=1 Tax=Paenibacillus solanacearum TaxID=2048548 RepID=A0A916JW05_9BACL|nr:glycoside hydrolase family 43 protein [Paenibacillus solanacearum]CAG7607984.1 hypothetical protein PAESOLCIP111_01014 [Paenibacillus solanacearum]